MSDTTHHILGELSAYLDQTSSPAEVKRIEAHLKACSSCQRQLSELRAIRQIMRATPKYTPPESFYEEVMQRVDKPSFQWPSLGWGWQAKALASACLLLVVVWVTRVSRNEPAAPQSVPVGTRKESTDNLKTKVAQRAAESPAPSAPVAPAPAPNPVPAPASKQATAAVSPESPKPSAELEQQRTDSQRKALSQPSPTAAVSPGAAGQSQAGATLNSQPNNRAFLGTQSFAKKTSAADSAAPTASLDSAGTAEVRKGGLVNTANLPEWKGDNSGVLLPQNSIADSEESWHALWRQHMASDNAAVPEVDFARSIVVGVFAGQKPSAGYAVQIMEIKSIPNALVVNYTETTPPANAMSAAMITHPYHIKVIPKTNLIIQFKKN